jgi:hypothetical protein
MTIPHYSIPGIEFSSATHHKIPAQFSIRLIINMNAAVSQQKQAQSLLDGKQVGKN